MSNRTIATPRGQSTQHISMTAEQIAQRQSEIAIREVQIATANERAWRDEELERSDFTQAEDAPFTEQEKADWVTYRQELRDLPLLAGFPLSHTRPTRP